MIKVILPVKNVKKYNRTYVYFSSDFFKQHNLKRGDYLITMRRIKGAYDEIAFISRIQVQYVTLKSGHINTKGHLIIPLKIAKSYKLKKGDFLELTIQNDNKQNRR